MILFPERFNQAKPANFDGVFDWDFLKPAFAHTKIEPMDIDAIVERHGKVLIFETKAPDREISKGQKITLNPLLALGRGNVHVMVSTSTQMIPITFSIDLPCKQVITQQVV